MSKQSMLDEIKTRLSLLDVQVKEGGETDFSINHQLIIEGFGGKRGEIQLSVNAFLDEQNKVLYYYEKIVDKQKGFGFSGNADSSFQSGKSIKRKVIIETIQSDGTKKTISFNTGDVSQIFKDAAKQHGWKYKTVLRRGKAIYPVGYIGLSGAKAQVSAPPNLGQQQQQQQQEMPIASKKAKGLITPWKIMFGIFVLIYLVVFLMGGASAPGVILGAAVLGATYFMRSRMMAKGCLTMVLMWTGVLVILFVLLMFTIGSDDIEASQINQDLLEQAEVAQPQETVFYAQSVSRSLFFSQTVPIPFEKSTFSLFGEIGITIQDATFPTNIEANALQRVTVKNIEIISLPNYGTASIIKIIDRQFPGTLEQREQAMVPSQFDIPVYEVYEEGIPTRNKYINANQRGGVNIFYAVYDIFDSQVGVDPAEELKAKIKEMGITQDDLKGIVSFDVEIETKDGRLFSRHFEESMLEGDLQMEMYVGSTSEIDLYDDNPEQLAWIQLQ